MDIRPVFFKEIGFTISLKNWLSACFVKYIRVWEGKIKRRFFLPKVGLMSILQNSNKGAVCHAEH